MLEMIADKKKWFEAVKSCNGDYEEAFEAYKKSGGRIGKRESTTSSASSQLLRSKPKWAESHKMFESFRPTSVDPEKREVQVILISEGRGNSRDKNYYTEAAIRDGVKKFNGARSFLNHQNREERQLRPEQDVSQLCGYFKNTQLVRVTNESGKQVWAVAATMFCDASEAGDQALAKAIASVRYAQEFPNSKEVYAGLSINAGGVVDGTVEVDGDDWNQVVGFGHAMSVDVVTRPARGGAFQNLLESVAAEEVTSSKQQGGNKMDKKAIIKALNEAKAQLEKAKGKVAKETLEAQVAELSQELAELVILEAEAEDVDASEAFPPKDKKAKDKAAADDEGDAEEAQAFEAMSKLAPKMASESVKVYESRIKSLLSQARGKKESKGVEDLSLEALTESTAADKAKDSKALLESNRQLRAELRSLKLKAHAASILAESTVPAEDLTVEDLVEAGSVEAMEALLGRTERMYSRFGNITPGKQFQGKPKSGVTRESMLKSGLLLKQEVAS